MIDTILLVDDEQHIIDLAKMYLEQEGWKTTSATDGAVALQRILSEHPALVVLDLMLPGLDGIEVCRSLRAAGVWSPVLLLTARDAIEDRVRGLDGGADDYLTKPFSPRELVARVRAILRRTQTETPLVEVLSFDDGALEIDTVQHEVRRDGETVDLTPNEYKLLQTLARYPGRVYSRFELINHVQGYDYEGYERTIDAHGKNLRKKIEPDPRHPRYVETVFGAGYRLHKA